MELGKRFTNSRWPDEVKVRSMWRREQPTSRIEQKGHPRYPVVKQIRVDGHGRHCK